MSKKVEAIYPLSTIQEGILFHCLESARRDTYVGQLSCELRGALDVEAFRAAWQALVERHAVLRTALVWDTQRPVQVVARHVELPLAVEDVALDDVEARLDRERRRGFDLARAPLLCLCLLRTGERTHRFVWTQHHAVLDGWSLALLLDELFALYGGTAEGDLPRRRPYRDYVSWLGEARQRRVGAAEAYWRRALAGLAGPTELVLPRPAGAVGGRNERRRRLPAALARRLGELARWRRLTLATLVQGAWALYLGRTTGERRVVFGVVVSGRPPELEGAGSMVGLFINTLPLRPCLPEAALTLAWLEDLRDRQVELREHEATPLVEVRKWSGLPAGTPLFESLVVFENYPAEGIAGARAGLEIADVRSVESAHYPVVLMAVPDGDGLELRLSGDAERLDGAALERILGELEHLLGALVERSEEPLGRLELLTGRARRQILEAWNATAVELSGAATLHGLVEAQARRSPDAVALLYEGRALTYRQLDRQANGLAVRLRQLGVGAEARVAVAVERSLELPLALLAILKAGGAWVPLDPSYPAARLAFMLEDAGAAVLLVGEAPPPGLEHGALPTLQVDAAALPALDAPPRSDVIGASAAYVIYTSGSTGRPKGVVNTHAGIRNRLLWMQAEYGLGSDDRVLQKTPTSFDVSVWELFWPLLAGAQEVLARPGGHQDGRYLLRSIERYRITTLHFVPPMLAALLGEDDLDALRAVRRVVASGEALPAELARRFTALRPPGSTARLHNLYGPTEAAIDVTYHPCDDREPGAVPIGRPVANTRLYLLDPGLRPVGVAIPGHLHLAGVQLARGYHRRPARTAAAFVPDPFASGGERLYRTFDLARYRDDGAVEFLGRLDHQVKVRGLRIELGEVEAALRRHPAVGEAVVTLERRGDGGAAWLAAWLVPRAAGASSAPLELDALRRELGRTLPEHMLPATFTVLEALPLGPNGKVDRKDLSALAGEAGEPERRGTAPRTPAEERLAAIWAELLELPSVAVEDSFFALGGDSILAIQVVSRARRAGLALEVQDLFRHRSLGELAAVASSASSVAVGASKRADRDGVARGEVPLTPIQRWFFAAPPRRVDHFNQALVLRPREPLSPAALAGALGELLVHHGALRLRFTRHGDGWRQAYGEPGGEPPLGVVDLGALPTARRRGALESAAAGVQGGLDLERGPIVRLVLFTLGNGGQRLLGVIHHLAVDAVSWRILLEDLEQAYGHLLRGEPADLPPPTASFGAWAEALCRHAEPAAAQGPFWRQQIAALPGLPVDHPGEAPDGAHLTAAAHTVRTTFAGAAARGLWREAHGAFRTSVEELLLAALTSAFTTWSGQPALRLDLEAHGREGLPDPASGGRLDLSRTVGWLTSLFPLRLEAHDDPAVLIQSVKERRRAVPEGGLGWGLLDLEPVGLETAGLKEVGSQVLFNYVGRLDAPPGGLFERAGEDPGPAAGDGPRRYLFEIQGGRVGDTLQLTWTYSEARHRRDTVEALTAAFAAALERLIAVCLEPGAGGWTPSDVPLAGLDQDGLDRLHGELQEVGAGPLETCYPLSPAQQGMLFFALTERSETGLFSNQMSCELRGPLEVERFRAAWERVVERHEVLRSAIVWEGLERPLQAVWGRVEVPWLEEDWQRLADGARDVRWAALLASDRGRGFDLARPPLLRCTLVRTAAERHRFLWTCHQLILDGWSVQRVLGEVFAFYRSAGTAPSLAPPVPFSDYIAWIERQDPEQAEDFWRRRLAGVDAATLPGVERRSPAARRPGERCRRRLDAALSERLEALVRHRELTASTVLLGAWAWLLGRYSGCSRVLTGCVAAGRPPELEGWDRLVGLCINALPVAVRLPPGAGAGAWLVGLQEEMAELRRFEHCPVEQIQRWLGWPRDQPLFDHLFIFENYPLESSLANGGASDGELELAAVEIGEAPNYALNLFAVPRSPLELDLVYDGGRYDASTAERLLDHLVRAVEQIVTDPERRLGELSLLGAGERQHLVSVLARRPDVEVAAPPALPVGRRIAERAERAPTAPAVVAGDAELSYGELVARVEALARRLTALGVGAETVGTETVVAETVVALVAGRSFELVVGLLGILEAGGVYLPLDPETPAHRVAFLLDDAGARLVLTDDAHRGLPFGERPVSTVGEAVDAGLEPGERGPGERWHGPEQAAYVIYTSGSTGRPKGVVVSHGALASHAAGAAESYGLGPGERVLQFASPSFDASVEEIFPTLVAGATLVLRRGELGSTPEFLAACRADRLSVLDLPTAWWHTLVADADREAVEWPPSVRRVILGGEEARAAALASWRRWAGASVELFNTYGPTEATVVATRWAAPSAGSPPGVPIGRPVAGTRALVVDGALELVAAGVPGELCLGGREVARGYLGRPGLTGERFVPDPFGGEGERLYRTGDRVRWGVDEELEYLGRLDQQLKIRGYRIEPGEVEAVLAAHPRVRQAAVAAVDESGERLLVAWVAASEGVAAAELRAFVGERCPGYMVPSRVVRVDGDLPRTPAGKIDRRALPAPERRPASGDDRPQGELEEVLAEIFAEVLGRERVGVNDDFFELGGHSLLATRLATRVRTAFSVELPLAELFTARTVADLALVVEGLLIARLEAMSDEEVASWQEQL